MQKLENVTKHAGKYANIYGKYEEYKLYAIKYAIIYARNKQKNMQKNTSMQDMQNNIYVIPRKN